MNMQAIAALIAGALPAWRAAHTEPMTSLLYDPPHSLRGPLESPGVFPMAVITLALGANPTSPFTYAAVAVFLAAVALAACYLPARCAVRQDQVAAVRQE